jgi:hypothetical protein
MDSWRYLMKGTRWHTGYIELTPAQELECVGPSGYGHAKVKLMVQCTSHEDVLPVEIAMDARKVYPRCDEGADLMVPNSIYNIAYTQEMLDDLISHEICIAGGVIDPADTDLFMSCWIGRAPEDVYTKYPSLNDTFNIGVDEDIVTLTYLDETTYVTRSR